MRFRLRTLLIVFMLLALSAPWWQDVRRRMTTSPQLTAPPRPRANTLQDQPPDQQRAVRRILALGGDWEAPNRTVLIGLIGPRFTDVEFQSLLPLVDVKYLAIIDVPATDDALEHIKNLQQLADVYISSCRFSGVGFRHLRNLKSLKRIVVEDTPLTDDALMNLSQIATLESIQVSSDAITDNGIRNLTRLTKLKKLAIDSASVSENTDAEMERSMPGVDISIFKMK